MGKIVQLQWMEGVQSPAASCSVQQRGAYCALSKISSVVVG